jgi:hypothetical protein
VDHFGDRIKEDERRDPSNDLVRIKKAQGQISAAMGQLRGLERDGRDALRYAGSKRLATMLSAYWVTHRSPGEAPSTPSARHHRPQYAHHYEGLVHQFISYRAPEAFKAVLRDIEIDLASAARSLKSSRGRHALVHRHDFILRLADFWHDIGKKVVSTPGSEFEVFCNYIFKAVGWPTRGLRSAISDAVSNWLNSHKKTRSVSK